MIRELEVVVLTEDLSEYGLKAGDLGTIVMVHEAGTGYEVEFVTLTGETVALVTVGGNLVRSVGEGEIAHVRRVA